MLEIIKASELQPGDRFAKRNWMESAKNRIVYRVAPSRDAKREKPLIVLMKKIG